MLTSIDLSLLKKGDYISPDVISEHCGYSPESKDYSLAKLNLQGDIERHFLATTEKRATIKSEGDGIRILTDAEASVYNENQVELARKKMGRAHRRNLDVDEAELSSTERQAHYGSLATSGKYLQAMRKVRRAVEPTPHVRKTPAK